MVFFASRIVQTIMAAAVFTLPAMVAGLDNGDYVIYSRVLDPNGQKLAITFQGNNEYATMEPLTYSSEQTWTVSLYTDGTTHTVVPISSNTLQAGWGLNGVEVFPNGGYVWIFNDSVNGWTIETGDGAEYWGNAADDDGSTISVSAPTGAFEQLWVLEKTA